MFLQGKIKVDGLHELKLSFDTIYGLFFIVVSQEQCMCAVQLLSLISSHWYHFASICEVVTGNAMYLHVFTAANIPFHRGKILAPCTTRDQTAVVPGMMGKSILLTDFFIKTRWVCWLPCVQIHQLVFCCISDTGWADAQGVLTMVTMGVALSTRAEFLGITALSNKEYSLQFSFLEIHGFQMKQPYAKTWLIPDVNSFFFISSPLHILFLHGFTIVTSYVLYRSAVQENLFQWVKRDTEKLKTSSHKRKFPLACFKLSWLFMPLVHKTLLVNLYAPVCDCGVSFLHQQECC